MTFGDTATSIQRFPMRVPRINGLMSGSSRVIGPWASTLDATQPTESGTRSTIHCNFQNSGPPRSLSHRMTWLRSADKRVNPRPAMGHLLNRWILYGQHKAKKRGAADRSPVFEGTDRLRGLAAFRDARQQDQDQSVEEKRDYQRCGVAKAQVFHEEFERSERDGRVCEPREFNPPLE